MRSKTLTLSAVLLVSALALAIAPSASAQVAISGSFALPHGVVSFGTPYYGYAGYAPSYRETPLEDDAMAPARDALEKILAGHEPFPALIVNRRWDIVSANRPAMAILTEGVATELLAPPINALRVSLHPDGLAPRIANLAQWSAHLLTRLRREANVEADPSLDELYDELSSYPGVAEGSGAPLDPAALLFVPLRLRSREGHELAFLSTVATFGTALDLTLAELSIESFFPADSATEAALRSASAPSAASDPSPGGGDGQSAGPDARVTLAE